jgi:putative spermidine/putrescine transport system substrate-binding protein
MKRLTATAAILAALAVPAVLAPAQAADLTVVSWGGAYQKAQNEIYFQPFAKQTGINLVQDSWDGGIGILRSKVEAGTPTWDVVQVESEELQVGCDEGLFDKLDWTKIGGKDAYLSSAVNPCGVGAILYNFVLAYDGDKIKDGPKSWADFFDKKKWPGKRALRKGPKTSLEIALMGDGVAPGDVYKVLATPEGVDRAFHKLDQIKSDIVWWEAGAQPPQLLGSGEVAMASAYNGRIAAANEADKRHFQMVWNGSLYTIDSWVILKGSKHIDAAYKFLDFVGQPDNQAKLPKFIPYGVTTKQAAKLIPASLLQELPTSPQHLDESLHIDDAFWAENIDRLNERFNAWVAK